MLKKEINEIVKQTMFLIGVLFVYLTIMYTIEVVTGGDSDFFKYFQIFYQIYIFVFSFFLGLSLFSYEIRNGGFEYLLTLPVTRTKLLLTKILPRLVMLIILYLGYLVLLGLSTTKPFVIPPELFNSLYFSLFFISTAFSVMRGNFVANSLLTMFMFTLFILAANFVVWFAITKHFGGESFKMSLFVMEGNFPFHSSTIYILSTLLALPFIASLFYGFKRYDIRTSGRYIKRFVVMFIPLFIIGMIISWFILGGDISTFYDNYYLTREGNVIKHNFAKSYILENGEEKEIPNISPWWFNSYERGDSVYLLQSNSDRKSGKVIRFDKKSQKIVDLYIPATNRYLVRRLYGYKENLVFMEMEGKRYSKNINKYIVFLNVRTKGVSKVKTGLKNLSLCGVIEKDKERSWIGYYIKNGGLTVYTIEESGKYREILRSDIRPVYSNGILVTYKKGHLELGRFSGPDYELIKKIKIEKDIFYTNFIFFNGDLALSQFKYLYGKKVENDRIVDFYLLDLENMSITAFSPGTIRLGIIRPGPFGNTYFTEFDAANRNKIEKVYKFEGKDLIPLLDLKEANETYLRFLQNGVTIRDGKNIKFYTYPDLKKLKF